MQIIGVTGTFAAGKGTLVDYLVKEYGCHHYSASEYLAKFAEKRGEKKLDRDTLTRIGNELRRDEGAGAIMTALHHQALVAGVDRAIIESVRNPAEIRTLRGFNIARFRFYGVDAPREIRYKRALERGTVKDGVSIDKFCEQEDRENSSHNSHHQNLSVCMKKTDRIFTNDGTLEKLYQEIDEEMQAIQISKIKKTSAILVG